MSLILTEEQNRVVESVSHEIKVNNTQVVTVGGHAGCGKTTIATKIYHMFPDFLACSFTGKAASVMRFKGMTNAATIHSTIYYPVREDGDDEDPKNRKPRKLTDKAKPGKVEFRLKYPEDLNCGGFLIDEASMVSREEYHNLLSFKKPIIFIGDHGQLEPVGSDVNVMLNPMFRLETIHRNAGEIAHFAEHLRKGRPARTFKSSGKVQIAEAREATDDIVSNTDQIICAFNSTRKGMNNNVRRILNRKDGPEVGDRIIGLRNNKHYQIFNGLQGVITSITPKNKKLSMELEDGTIIHDIPYIPEQFESEQTLTDTDYDRVLFDYGYCITAHKCVTPDTLVETAQGLVLIRQVAPEGTIATPRGPRPYGNVVFNEASTMYKITTNSGHSVTVTPEHGLDVFGRDGYARKNASELRLGDVLRIRLGVGIEPATEATVPSLCEDLYLNNHFVDEKLGLWLGIAIKYTRTERDKIVISSRTSSVAQTFFDITKELFTGLKSVELKFENDNHVLYIGSGDNLARWLRRVKNDSFHTIPHCVLRSNSKVHAAFLRGLLADSFLSVADDKIFSFSCPVECRSGAVILTMLARLGVSAHYANSYLNIYGLALTRFNKVVGHVSQKNQLLSALPVVDDLLTFVPVESNREIICDRVEPVFPCPDPNVSFIYRYVMESLDPNAEELKWHHDQIVSLEVVFDESMCVEVPDGHQFLQNGISGWNSQGSEWPNVIVYEQICKKWDHARWAYTAASRAKTGLIWLTPNPRW
jgi:exodeoxyribonuclease-5